MRASQFGYLGSQFIYGSSFFVVARLPSFDFPYQTLFVCCKPLFTGVVKEERKNIQHVLCNRLAFPLFRIPYITQFKKRKKRQDYKKVNPWSQQVFFFTSQKEKDAGES